MKKALLIVVVLACSAVAIWRWHLSAPSYAHWKSLKLTERRSFWPYVTCVNVRYNGVSVSSGDEVISESRWLDFDLWNGNRVDDLWIYAVTSNGEFIIYPGPENHRQMAFHGGNSGILAGVMFVGGDDSRFKPPACEVRLSFDPPPDSVIGLRVVATDGKGNQCEGTIAVSSIQ